MPRHGERALGVMAHRPTEDPLHAHRRAEAPLDIVLGREREPLQRRASNPYLSKSTFVELERNFINVDAASSLPKLGELVLARELDLAPVVLNAIDAPAAYRAGALHVGFD